MALIVEDGTGLADADSYISLVDARAYASKYGYVLPIDDDEADVMLRKGTLYVDLYESSFSGSRLNDTQALAWARVNAYKCSGYNQIPIASDSIPNEIKCAQVIAANAYSANVDVRANNDGKAVASEEVVGAVKVAYFDNGKTGSTIEITAALDMINSLMCSGGFGLSARTVRV